MALFRREGMSVVKLFLFSFLGSLILYLFLNSKKDAKELNEEIKYAIVLDAGSTGSRIHVYTFGVSEKGAKIKGEIFEQKKPGLSSYKDSPNDAGLSLKSLLDIARDSIPSSEHSCTPLILRATAGLRLIPDTSAVQSILNSVEKVMKSYGFYMPNDAVSIMDGDEEGVYAWITVNFLLDRLGGNKRKETVGIMDLGGGSTQIVFEPKNNAIDSSPAEFVYKLNFGGFEYKLYQNSYLGYGLMEARKKIKSVGSGSCLPTGFSEGLLQGKGGSFEECSSEALSILEKEKPCGHDSCSFNGVYQPSYEYFPSQMYAFSYFYDLTENMESPFPNQISAATYKKEATKACSSKDPKDQFSCMDLSFIYNLLVKGYGFPEKSSFTLAKKIQSYETGWCLGAAIKVLDSTRC